MTIMTIITIMTMFHELGSKISLDSMRTNVL
jgi:hypothetical protein